MVFSPSVHRRSRAAFVLAACLALPSTAAASDFSFLMWLLLIPCAMLAGLVWLATWFSTSHMKPSWKKTAIRAIGACLVLTPTYTSGGNGQQLSIAAYDFVLSALGGDPIYARQALINALCATVLVLAILPPMTYQAWEREGDREN